MQTRPHPVRRILPLVAAWSAVSLAAGCSSGLFTVAYLLRGNDVPPECDALKNKRVAVVCRPMVALQYRNARVDHDLAQELSSLLRSNVPKIKLIDYRRVAEWMDEHTWDDYTEVGKALGADLVVGIDLEHFDIYQSQTLYQGRASVEVKLYDCQTGNVVFKKHLPQIVYPPNRVVQASEVREQEFRREFVRVLADQIGKHFYAHDPYADFAMDSKNIE